MSDRIIFVCTLIVAAVYFYATTLIPSLEIGDPLGPKAFPRLLGIFLLIAAALLFVEMWKERGAAAPRSSAAAGVQWRLAWVVAAVAAWTAAYYAVFEKLGYIAATAIYLFALMAWFNRGKWGANGLTAVLFALGGYWMFVKLEVSLPKGILAF